MGGRAGGWAGRGGKVAGWSSDALGRLGMQADPSARPQPHSDPPLLRSAHCAVLVRPACARLLTCCSQLMLDFLREFKHDGQMLLLR